MKSNLAYQQEIDNEITLHPSTAKKIERQIMSKKEEGYTRTPNALIDDQIMAQLKDKAFKCLMFIVRQTIGFDRTSHTIAITQFQKYCGIKKRDTVMSSISELEDAKLISVVRKTGCLNEYFLTLNQYQQTGLVPVMGSTIERDGTSTINGDGTSTVERDTIKETLKENIKETHTIENSLKNSVDEILNLWKPNLDSLNSWLQRAGEKSLTQSEMENTLLEVNAHYERQIRSDLVSDSKMYSNFVKWVKGDFSKNKKSNSNIRPSNLNVNDAWADIPQFSGPVQHVEIPEDFI
ncbi:replication protein [Acinetobacter bereziniae]|uniref:replication protein n=1 Tax=Acinetobacter bereziniae TaxID=106648 RepID=UPI0019028EE7|nr:replication protein [Acinetobacter bereziniae]MBJ8450303.1 replication protein [Acinetobacter bereziniae]MBJ8454662.1 replication protein [Acinetobacter bereziniae]